jgi:hypothetical protein
MLYHVTSACSARYAVGLLCLVCLSLGLLPAQAGQGAAVLLPNTPPLKTTLQQHVRASALPLLRLLAQPAPKPVALPAFVERLAPVMPTGLRRLESSGMTPDPSVYRAW